MASPSDASPIWLAHHWPDQYDRCVRVGHTHVCRRCLVLYPLIVVTAVVAVLIEVPDAALWAAWVLPLPLAIEWTGEHLGRFTYSAARQVALTAVAAVGFGTALAVHIEDPFTLGAVAPVACYVIGLFLVSILTRGNGDDEDWEERLERSEASRTEELHRLLAEADAAIVAGQQGQGPGLPGSGPRGSGTSD